MRLGLVIMAHPYTNLLTDLKPGFKGVQIHALIFQTPSKPFNEHIIYPPPFVVHRDYNPVSLENPCKIKARKLASLIRVEDFRLAMQIQHFLQCLNTTMYIHRAGYPP